MLLINIYRYGIIAFRMENMKKIALTGGGTAGHITPNLALIPELKKRGYDVIYIGGKNNMECDACKIAGIAFFGITSDKLRRYFDLKNFIMPFNVIRGIIESYKILKAEKVNIIFSKGGYVSVPVIIAGSMLHIPIISHEADFTPGLANRIATPLSKVICCNFKETAKMLKGKGVWTGLPIRKSLLNGNAIEGKKWLGFDDDKPIIFITGGSLGAKYINELIRKNLDRLLINYNIAHQCGKGKVDKSIEKNGYKQFDVIINELPNVMAAADFVISRAGANIIFELLALNKPNILIPLSKRASRGDQEENAKSFESNNFSIVLFEEDENQNNNLLFDKIDELNNKKYEMVEAMKKAPVLNSIGAICDVIENSC